MYVALRMRLKKLTAVVVQCKCFTLPTVGPPVNHVLARGDRHKQVPTSGNSDSRTDDGNDVRQHLF